MADPIATETGSILRDAPAHRVYTRARWGDAWAEVPHLYCDRLTFAVGPDVSSAEFTWRYGVGRRPTEDSFATHEPLDLLDHFVKVEVDQTDAAGDPTDPILWHGIVAEELRDAHGSAPEGADPERVPRGIQRFTAYGLEHLLDRVTVNQSVIKAAAGAADEAIERALVFNGGAGSTVEVDQANGANSGQLGIPVFARELETALRWTAGAIAVYLIQYFAPRDATGQQLVEFTWDTTDLAAIETITSYRPRLAAHGRTVKALLDELFDRRRLLGWKITVDDATNKAVLSWFTHADVDIDLTDVDPAAANQPGVFRANTNQRAIDYGLAFDVQAALERSTTSHRFDVVRARGARAGTVCTLSVADGTLVADWDAAAETAYKAAASAAGDYGGLTTAEKAKRNDEYRAADAFARVYRAFRLPANWSGLVGDGIGGTLYAAFPAGFVAGVQQSQKFWRPGLRIESTLPLLSDHDYSGGNINDGTIIDNTPSGGRAQPLRPFAAIKLENDGSGTDRWQLVERLATAAASHLPDTGGRDWAAHLSVLDEQAGIALSSSTLPHAWAATDFTSAEASDVEAELDWKDNLLATVYVESDTFVAGEWPAQLPADRDYLRVLELDLGQYARLDYVAPGTVVAIADGELVRSTSGGFIRDDRARLTDIARIAYEWYSRQRRAFELPFRQVRQFCRTGEMITTIGPSADPDQQTDVYACITEITYDLVAGQQVIKTDVAAFTPI